MERAQPHQTETRGTQDLHKRNKATRHSRQRNLLKALSPPEIQRIRSFPTGPYHRKSRRSGTDNTRRPQPETHRTCRTKQRRVDWGLNQLARNRKTGPEVNILPQGKRHTGRTRYAPQPPTRNLRSRGLVHHPAWESRQRTNDGGRNKAYFIENNTEVALVTPKDTPIRICPTTGTTSTIDLALASFNIAMMAQRTTGPYMGSDHLPIIVELACQTPIAPLTTKRWTFNEEKWPDWNRRIEEKLKNTDLEKERDPDKANEIFTEALVTAAKEHFR